MIHFSTQSQTPTINDSKVISVANICVAENSELLASTLCPTFSTSVFSANSHISINSIVGLGYQDKAWMSRNTVTVGRRTKFP